MIRELAQKTGDSLWRKVGEKAVVTAVTTLLSEAIKASVEIVKKGKLREQKAEFDDRREREKKAREPDEPQADEEIDEPEDDAADVAESDQSDESGESEGDGGPKVSFASYVDAHRR